MECPKFSIVVPVWHEGKKINDLIEHLNRFGFREKL